MESGVTGEPKKSRCCSLMSFIGRRRQPPPRPADSTPQSNRPPQSPKLPPPRPVGRRLPPKENPPLPVVLRSPKLSPAPATTMQIVPTPGNGLSGELERMIFDYQMANRSINSVRASSGNGTVCPQLGNIYGGARNAAKEMVTLKRGDPDKLKEMGNEELKRGRFGQALALYEEAISLAPEKATYRSNKAAALIGMGRLIEAVAECKEAVRIDPSHGRAHHRLASLYHRLGESERAVHHYVLSQKESDPEEISRAKMLQTQIVKCIEARKLKDWQTMLKECQSAISNGADSAPKVFAWQAEALVKLGKHEEADMVLKNAPKFDPNAATSLFGAATIGHILIIQAQVDLASGRIEEAVAAAKRAAKVAQTNQEVIAVVEQTGAVASARSKGNELFGACKYSEASSAYAQGLAHDPHNALLLCNRAACRSKLGLLEEAIEDCNAALSLRPSYAKARLRRADCFAKLGRWEAALEDYEALMRDSPADEEVSRALSEARSQLEAQGSHLGLQFVENDVAR
ncbi:hypothetical protein HPP92_012672 [Vanilla planifolia]|uniref:Uncharacterized protein n=1 Tax=Vanilla planifolia TaxID=51239 RepID=A0A835UWB6_VANPL|nr:hypothetical protein HPP92_013084 [Vanilla planifolia]KAG0477953.1 hypothetical protein HPP92_012672 [Vanilla planifolia]